MKADQLLSLIEARTSASLKLMVAPGPHGDELTAIVNAAAAAPDHGRLHPFRIIEIPSEVRNQLGDLFAKALYEAKGEPTEEALERAKEKAQRGPVLLALIGCFHDAGAPAIPKYEQMISAGAALQNMVLMAHAMGYASRITSGQSVRTKVFHDGLGLSDSEEFLCFVSLGKVEEERPAKGRQTASDILTKWAP